MVQIVEITSENKQDLHKANQPFDIIGRLNIQFINGEWTYGEIISTSVTRKQYPNYDGATTEEYIDSSHHVAYLAFHNSECVGQILLAKTWNNYAHIEDISIAENFRGQGIGTNLLSQAYAWAEKNNIKALSLECQDNNILASRFFHKNGFKIGGINTELYAMLGQPYANETAIFWYKTLQQPV